VPVAELSETLLGSLFVVTESYVDVGLYSVGEIDTVCVEPSNDEEPEIPVGADEVKIGVVVRFASGEVATGTASASSNQLA
jgi:hypothetical protein